MAFGFKKEEKCSLEGFFVPHAPLHTGFCKIFYG
jgi:hypothetical protein